MLKFKRGLSVFLAIAMVMSIFAGVSTGFAPKASAAAGTSSIRSYADLEAAYDSFIYLGLEAYEADGTLTDGYVQPGDEINFRMYIKSDRYMGNGSYYSVFDNNFFDVTNITHNASKTYTTYSGVQYENNSQISGNSAHPLTSEKGLYGIIASKPARAMTQFTSGNVGIDASLYNTWDLVVLGAKSDTSSAPYAHRFIYDEYVYEWYATVKAGLADGTTGYAEIREDLFKHISPKKVADIPSLTISDPNADHTTVLVSKMGGLSSQKSYINEFNCDNAHCDFTIGNPPAGGTTYAATFKVDDAVVSTADYATGASIEAPVDDPVKAGYTFLGWALEGTTDVLTFPQTMGSAAVTYVAIFEQIATYTATFKVDGVVYGEVKSYQAGETIVAPADPTKTGYTFAGWDPTVGVMGEADIVFNATFTAKTYNVKFYTDETTEYTTLTVSYNGAYNLPSPPTKTGYSFAGWKTAGGSDMPATHTTDADAAYYAAWTVGTFDAVFVVDGETYRTVPTVFGEAIVAPEAPTKTGYTFAGWSPEVGTMDAEGKTFTATWTAISVGVHFMDGDKELELKTGDYGTSITAINNPSKDGYTFAGWQYTDGSTATFPITLGTEDVYVYAQWTAKEYYIEFFGPGATDWLSGGNQLCGDAIVAPDAPSKTGYNFTGWADAEGNPMPETVPAVENQQYFAQYEAITYTATFLADGAVHHTFDGIYKSSITAPATNPEKTGYTFSHWVKQGSTTKVTFPQSMPVGGVTYEAVFTVNNYNINYYVDGTLVKTESYAYGAAVTPYAYTPAEGQSFSGWGDQVPATMPANDVNVYGTTGVNTYNVTFTVNGETYQVVPFAYGAAVTAPSYTVPEGHSFSGWNVPETMPANNITLDATLEKNTYNAIFYLDDAKTQVYATVPTVYGETIVFPENPSVDGKEFTGWDNAATVMGAGDMEFVAMFTDIEYFIEFLNEDGTAIEGYDWVAYWGDEITADQAPTVTKEGYAFAGWLVDGSKVTFPVVVNSDLTFTASFKINGYDITYMVDGVEYAVDTYQFGEAVTMRPAPEKEGYTFSGWDKTAPATMPAENIVISGTFTVNQYDALFYSEGVLIATVPTNYGEVPVAPEDPVKTGYNFVGWTPTLAAMGIDGARYDAVFSAGSVAYTVNVYTMDLTGNYGDPVAKTLYGDADTEATYTPDALEGFTVADNSVLSGTVAADGSLVLSVYYSRNQYTFKTVVDGVETPVTYYYGADVAAVEDPAKTGYTFDGWDKEIPATMPAADVTVTAQWTINQYTITFDTDGGSTVAPITQDYATDITAPEAPTKTGYTFAGWTPAVPDTMPAENVTVEAQWNINSYKLSFEVDGAVVRGPEDVEFDSAITAPSVDEKEGYTFVGWFAKETGEAMPAKMPAKDVVYEAVWTNGTNTRYTIEVYMMDTNGNYSLSAATVAYGTTGSVQTIVPGTIVGCTVDTALSELSKAISADGSMVLKVYYARNIYTVTYDSEAPVNVYYGAAIPAYEPAAQTGKTFTGWSPEVPATMPAENLVFTSTWEDTLYTITYVVNGTKSVAQYAYGAAVVAPEDPTVDGMTFTGWEPAVPDTMPAEDLIIVAKFENAVYKVTYLTDVGGEVFEEMLVRAGETVPVPTETPEKEYYVFLNWDNVPAVMPANNITIVPVFERVPVKLIPMAGSTTVIDRDNMVIYGLRERLTEELLLGTYLDVEGDGYITITPVADRCYGTGTIVDLYDNVTGEKLETYVIVVFGDLNGDSRVNSTDASMADDEAFRLTSWSSQTKYVDGALVENPDYNPYRTMAADLNKDGKVNATDASDISNTSIGISLIDQTTGTVHR